MKKILIFSLAYYPRFTSGAEAAIKEITNRIDPSDIEFHMLTVRFDMKDSKYEKVDNVHVHRVGFGNMYLSKILFIPLSAIVGISLHRKYNFSAIWSMMTYMLLPVTLMRLFGTRIPHVLTLQDGDPYEKVFDRWFIRPIVPLINYGFRTASLIQVISSYLGTWPALRGYKGDIELIYNGANPRDIKGEFDEKQIKKLKEDLNKKDDDIFLINTARLVHQKAFDITIQALKLLPPNIKLVVVGGGSDEEMLKKLTKRLDLERRVMFTGSVDRSVVSNYRKVADIFVGPSRSEGLGNAFLSAMASRLPIVATQEGGIAEFLFDKKHNPDKEPTGWVVEKDNPKQIAQAVTYIVEHHEEVAQITSRAREMVINKFNWDIVAKDMREKVFRKVI